MRIVTHACSNTEIVAALGLGDAIVGCDDHSDFPPEVVGRAARVGPDLHVDVEKVKALRPDLVVYSLTIPGHERALAFGWACHIQCRAETRAVRRMILQRAETPD